MTVRLFAPQVTGGFGARYRGAVILDRLDVPVADLPVVVGWRLSPDGLCRGDRCVPFVAPADGSPSGTIDVGTASGTIDVGTASGTIDVGTVAERLGMAVVADDTHGLWAIGPESSGRVLESAELPEIRLPDLDGHELDLAELRGRKLVLMAWASW